MLKLTPLIISLALLSGCAITKEECRVGNWSSIGRDDGLNGHSADRIEAYNKKCSKIGVTPNFADWDKGREEGLKQYCTPQNAFALGKRGRIIRPNCPEEKIDAMQSAHAKGKHLYGIEQEIRALQSERLSIRADIAGLPADAPGRGGLSSDALFLQFEIDSLRAEYHRLERRYLASL